LDLPENGEVNAFIDSTGVPLDTTIGRLTLLWLWVDREWPQARMIGITIKTLCRKFGGNEPFWRAVEKQDWLIIGDDFIEIPDWEKRFSQSARNRIATAQRVQSHRGRNGDVTAKRYNGVTSSLSKSESESESEPISVSLVSSNRSMAQPDAAALADCEIRQETWDAETSELERLVPQNGNRDRRLLSQLGWLIAAQAPIVPAVRSSVEAVRVKDPPADNPIGYLRRCLSDRIGVKELAGWLRLAPPLKSRAPPAGNGRIPVQIPDLSISDDDPE
jgi:hypothetical protein